MGVFINNIVQSFKNYFSTNQKKNYNWNTQLNSYIDRAKIMQAPNLTGLINFKDLQRLSAINAFKAVLSPDQNYNPKIIYQNHASHFGSFAQAQDRFMIMEEDDWYIYRYTISLQKLYPRLFKDNGSSFNTQNKSQLNQVRKNGYNVIAYVNAAEGDINAAEGAKRFTKNLSLVVLTSNAILTA
jgi:hypothetical protein